MNLENVLLTVEDKKVFFDLLDSFENFIFDPSKNSNDFLESLTAGPVKDFLSQRLGGKSVNDLINECKNLRSEVLEIPVIALTVPVELNNDQKIKIAQFARITADKPVLIRFNVDPGLIGGALVEGDGRIVEYSFRRYFEEIIGERNKVNGV